MSSQIIKRSLFSYRKNVENYTRNLIHLIQGSINREYNLYGVRLKPYRTLSLLRHGMSETKFSGTHDSVYSAIFLIVVESSTNFKQFVLSILIPEPKLNNTYDCIDALCSRSSSSAKLGLKFNEVWRSVVSVAPGQIAIILTFVSW